MHAYVQYHANVTVVFHTHTQTNKQTNTHSKTPSTVVWRVPILLPLSYDCFLWGVLSKKFFLEEREVSSLAGFDLEPQVAWEVGCFKPKVVLQLQAELQSSHFVTQQICVFQTSSTAWSGYLHLGSSFYPSYTFSADRQSQGRCTPSRLSCDVPMGSWWSILAWCCVSCRAIGQ